MTIFDENQCKAGNHYSSRCDIATTVMLYSVVVFFRQKELRVDIDFTWRDHHWYHNFLASPDWRSGSGAVNGVYLDAVLGQELLSAEAGDSVDICRKD